MITYLINKTASLEKTACSISLGILGSLIWNLFFDCISLDQKVLTDFSPEQLLILGNPRQFEVLILTIAILGVFQVFNIVEFFVHRELKNFYGEFLFDRNEQIPTSIPKEETKPLSYSWDINFFYSEIPILLRDFQSFVSLIYLIITLSAGVIIFPILIYLQYPIFLPRYLVGELGFLLLKMN